MKAVNGKAKRKSFALDWARRCDEKRRSPGRQHGRITPPFYVWENGKFVKKKPWRLFHSLRHKQFALNSTGPYPLPHHSDLSIPPQHLTRDSCHPSGHQL